MPPDDDILEAGDEMDFSWTTVTKRTRQSSPNSEVSNSKLAKSGRTYGMLKL